MTEKRLLDLEEELDYYKTKCASLETGLISIERDKAKLEKENEQLREALKNSYVTELCENCKHVIYESWEVPFCGWEHDRECKKGHNECEVTECDDFELNLKVWLND